MPPKPPASNLTVGGKQYNEGDMLRMQRDAELRVREMQERARKTVEDANQTEFSRQPSPRNRNRNWNSNPSMFRQRGQRQQQNRQQKPPEPPPPPPKPPQEPVPPQKEEPPKKDGTIVGDIMDALGLDEDYLLIIGLLLILINQRADTTLILALAYLLI